MVLSAISFPTPADAAHPLPTERLANDALALPERAPSTGFKTEIAFPGIRNTGTEIRFEKAATPAGPWSRLCEGEQQDHLSAKGETMEFGEPLPESDAVFHRARFLTP